MAGAGAGAERDGSDTLQNGAFSFRKLWVGGNCLAGSFGLARHTDGLALQKLMHG